MGMGFGASVRPGTEAKDVTGGEGSGQGRRVKVWQRLR